MYSNLREMKEPIGDHFHESSSTYKVKSYGKIKYHFSIINWNRV